ncbi:alpha-N-acetylneuraminide alpha-2,8-sialyltransferase-like [Diadema antillarum]|uniref:alpha-N-acetylneuraminide alpha-2,8-sialyltransferase-like n=1 Tax=Diadema antillarum TaxID=105358 RepID=UPI003A85D2C5
MTSPLPKIGPRCAVVGSSGLLEGSRCGSAIDDNDFVFRVNLSPVGGPFEDDVGSKINVTTINRSQLVEFCRLKNMNRPINLYSDEHYYPIANRTSHGITQHTIIWYPRHSAERLGWVAAFFNEALDLWPSWAYSPRSLADLSSRVWGIPIASTGLSVITAAILHCDDVTLYGFYPFPRDSQNRKLRYHYYEDDGKETNGGHNMDQEYARMQQLDAGGVLRLVTEPCVAE